MASSTWGKAGRVAVWVLVVLEVLLMGLAGLAKFTSAAWPSMFEGWGYPRPFAYLIGALECVGALALLVPRLTTYAAAGLMVIMLGALWTVTTTTFETGLGPGMPLLHLALLGILAWARRRERWSKVTA